MRDLDRLDLDVIAILRRLQDGDVVWITVPEGMEGDELDAVQAILDEVIDVDVSMIITPAGYVEGIAKRSLDELMQLRAVIDAAVDAYAAHNVYEEV